MECVVGLHYAIQKGNQVKVDECGQNDFIHGLVRMYQQAKSRAMYYSLFQLLRTKRKRAVRFVRLAKRNSAFLLQVQPKTVRIQLDSKTL